MNERIDMKRSANFALCTVSRQRGFTLIETLIAALVLSVGLLGLAGLNAVSHKLTHSAYLRSQAASLAYEIADAMRANRANADDYYDKMQGPDDCNNDFVRPNTGDVASDDLAEWKNHIVCVLPEGSGIIELAASTVTITVSWNDSRAESIPEGETAPDPPAFELETQL